MKLPVIIISILMLTAQVRSADDAHKIEVIKEVLDTMGSRETLENLRIQNVDETRRLLFQQAGDKAGNPWMKRLLDRAMEKYAAYSKEMFDWNEKEKQYIDLYTQVFTEAQIEGVLAFYKSDPGQALIRFQPQLASLAQKAAFKRATGGEDRIDRIMKESAAEVQAELKKEGAIP